jgi:hypothetical protein
MDRLQQLIETLRVLARTNEPNRAVLIEKAVNEYLNDKAGIVALSLGRLCDAIDREEAEKRPIEDWSIAKDYVRSRLRRLVQSKDTRRSKACSMKSRHLNGLLIVATLLISTAPLYAQRREQNIAKLKADARNLVGIIGSDKAKIRTYCPHRALSKSVNAVQPCEFSRPRFDADQC